MNAQPAATCATPSSSSSRRVCLSSPSYARPAPSLLRTVVHFVSGPPDRGRPSWWHQWDHATSSCCGLVLPQLLSIQGSSLSAFTGRNSCTFDGTYSEARPDPFPDGGCASTSISNCPPRRTKLITSPVLRCSAQLPSAVTCTSWPVANKSREPSDVASSRCQT